MLKTVLLTLFVATASATLVIAVHVENQSKLSWVEGGR